MNILLTLLNEQLKSLLHADAEITENKAETLLTYPNPYGGKPLQVLYRPAEDFKVTLNKTPRYYQQDSTKRLLADVADIIELSIRINLLNPVELKDLLANGGTVNVHFWNAAKDFRYRQIGDRLEKI